MTELDEAEGLTAGDVMHRHISTLPSSATDENGALVGIVAVNHQRSGFCGT